MVSNVDTGSFGSIRFTVSNTGYYATDVDFSRNFISRQSNTFTGSLGSGSTFLVYPCVSSVDTTYSGSLTEFEYKRSEIVKTNIDISHCPSLEILTMHSINFGSFSIIDNPKFKQISMFSVSGSFYASNNSSMTSVYVSGGKMSDISITNCSALLNVQINTDFSGSIDLSTNNNMTFAYIASLNMDSIILPNSIIYAWLSTAKSASLDISGKILLENLRISKYPAITALDLSNRVNFKYIDIAGSNINTINLSNTPALTDIIASNSKLTELDASNHPNLKWITLQNSPNLTWISASNCPNLDTSFFAFNCNSLTSIHVENTKMTQTTASLNYLYQNGLPTANPTASATLYIGSVTATGSIELATAKNWTVNYTLV